MADVQKMESINSSPHITMSDITKRLFNRNFHSDVQFIVEGKTIYAHSLELIKRSVIFEQQLEYPMGNTKLIPIDDCKYESVLEFVRYIYTDECTIDDENFIDILNLATKYKLFKLENEVFTSSSASTEWLFKCFEYCILNNYEIARNFTKDVIALQFDEWLLAHKFFLTLHPSVVDELLKFQYVSEDVSEYQIFSGVADWLKSYCNTHQITLPEGRQRLDKLIRKIRFPTMSTVELGDCYKTFPEILSAADCSSIIRQTVFGGKGSATDLWISDAREKFSYPTELQPYHQGLDNNTIFSVSEDTLLIGLRIGIEEKRKPIEFEISETDDKTNVSQKIIFVHKAPVKWTHLIINLGDSLYLKPNFKYTIKIQFLEVAGNLKVHCLTEDAEALINDPGKTVNIIDYSANMVELIFKPVK